MNKQDHDELLNQGLTQQEIDSLTQKGFTKEEMIQAKEYDKEIKKGSNFISWLVDLITWFFGKLANDVTSELKLPKDSRANLNIYLGEIDWVAFHALVPAAIHYQPIPEFAPVQRDLALVATESMECGTLVTEMQRACKQLTKVELFDIYRGEKLGADKKSMAFSLSFQPADKPLTPDEIDRFVKKILGNLKFKLGIEIRE